MRYVWLLTLAQALAACGMVVVVLVAGILGATLAPRPELATLPVTLGVVGVALASVPAALTMQRIGRRAGFVASALGAAVAALGAAAAIALGSFAGFCAAVLLLGANLAFVQQYRFAAIEYAPDDRAARAVSIVMLGTLGAAWLGPALAVAARGVVPGAEYAGSFLALAGLYVLAAGLLSRLPPRRAAAPPTAGAAARPLRAIAADPRFRLAVLAGVVGYGVMSFIMTATPISMHVHHAHSLADTAWVIQSHLLAMYLPSLASGFLVDRLGPPLMMLLGTLQMAACVAIAALAGHEVVHYWWALVLLGVGWNLLFVGGTTLLTASCRPAERFRAQGANEFAVFGTQASASLLAGLLVHRLGWELLNLAAVPLLVLMLLALALRRSSAPPALAGPAPGGQNPGGRT